MSVLRCFHTYLRWGSWEYLVVLGPWAVGLVDVAVVVNVSRIKEFVVVVSKLTI